MVATAIGIGLLTSGLYDIGKFSGKKIWNLLNQDQYEDTFAKLGNEFGEALEEHVTDALDETDVKAGYVKIHWDRIEEELEETDLFFSQPEEAVEEITSAVMNAISFTSEPEEDIRRQVSLAVSEVYEDSIQAFLDKIEGSELDRALERELGIIISKSKDEILDKIKEIKRALWAERNADLRNHGFIRLDDLYWKRQSQKESDPVQAWRTGFKLIHIDEGYAIERERPSNDDTPRRSAVDKIFEHLRQGQDTVVLGKPGSGKSTLLKQVACRWSDEYPGAVFYHKSETQSTFDAVGTLKRAIWAVDGEVLVVVEDATDNRIAKIYEVIEEVGPNKASFLLDSRYTDWRNPDYDIGKNLVKNLRGEFETVDVPSFDKEECTRMIDHFKSITGKDITLHRSSESLWEDVQSAKVGKPLYLADQLTSDAIGKIPERGSEFRNSVERIFEELYPKSEELLPAKVGLLANILNAARLPIDSVYFHALIEKNEESFRLSDILENLTGDMLIEEEDERPSYRMFHEAWSMAYLKLASEKDKAHLLFQQTLEALFELFESKERRKEVKQYCGDMNTVLLERIDDSPEEAADTIVRRVSYIWSSLPVLSSLYSRMDIKIPESLPNPTSTEAKLSWINKVGEMYYKSGEYDNAKEMFNLGLKISQDSKNQQVKANTLINLGNVAQAQGRYEEAQKKFNQSLNIFRNIDYRKGEATSLNNLGNVARAQGRYEEARKKFNQSVEIFRAFDHRQGEANVLNCLGNVARLQGNYEDARKSFNKSLEIFRDIGDKQGRGNSLNDLANLALALGDYENARKKFKQSLEIFQDIGDQQGRAKALMNMGNIAQLRDNFNQAREYYHQALSIFRDIGYPRGKAKALINLGSLAQLNDNHQDGRKYYNKSLEISRALGHRKGEANALMGLGNIAYSQGDYHEAQQKFNQSLEIFRTIGDSQGEAKSLHNLGKLAREQGEYENAKSFFREAKGIFRKLGAVRNLLQVIDHLLATAEIQNDKKTAKSMCEKGLDIIAKSESNGLEPWKCKFKNRLAQIKETNGSINRSSED